MVTPRQTRDVWLIASILIVAATAFWSVVTYTQISRHLSEQVQRSLHWEAKLYSDQLQQVLHNLRSGVESAVNSPAIRSGDVEAVQESLHALKQSAPSIVRSWVIYESGQIIPSYTTREDYLARLAWWQEFLESGSFQAFSHSLLSHQILIGRPIPSGDGLTVSVPLIRFVTRNSHIIRTVVVELDLNHALLAAPDWVHNPVSLYSSDGILVARPYRYFSDEPLLSESDADDPLLRLIRERPDDETGFILFHRGNEKRAGVFLRVPALNMVITVERSAHEAFQPVRVVSWGALAMTVLSVVVASVIVYTLSNAYRRIHETRELALAAEFRALQAHINPHFLFNTLDRMVSKAVAHRNGDVIAMLRALADLFRYTVRRSAPIVTVEEELWYLERYVQLQRHRFGDRFQYKLDVDEGVLTAKIPKFTIQPLVENAFIHGVEESLDPVTIEVEVGSDSSPDSFPDFGSDSGPHGALLFIRVTDDGPGITFETRQRLHQSLAEESDTGGDRGKGMGLANIHKRIQHLYGRQFGVSFPPIEHGFCVQVTMPRVYEEWEAVD